MGYGDSDLMNTYLIPERHFPVGLGDPPPPGEMQNLRCLSESDFRAYVVGTATTAFVVCEFDVRADWGGFTAGGGYYDWTVSLQRRPPGSWLVDNYGEG
jgi:hypothetical protein